MGAYRLNQVQLGILVLEHRPLLLWLGWCNVLGRCCILFFLQPRKWACIQLLVDCLALVLRQRRLRRLLRLRRRKQRRIRREMPRVDIANADKKFVCVRPDTYTARP